MKTLAGGNGEGYSEGKGSAAKFNRPWGLVVGDNDVIYVADSNNYRIRACTQAGSALSPDSLRCCDYIGW